jgi:hypothetical protein
MENDISEMGFQFRYLNAGSVCVARGRKSFWYSHWHRRGWRCERSPETSWSRHWLLLQTRKGHYRIHYRSPLDLMLHNFSVTCSLRFNTTLLSITSNVMLCHIECHVVPHRMTCCATSNVKLCHIEYHVVPHRMSCCVTSNDILCHLEWHVVPPRMSCATSNVKFCHIEWHVLPPRRSCCITSNFMLCHLKCHVVPHRISRCATSNVMWHIECHVVPPQM